MDQIKIIINNIPPSNNKYLGNSHNFNIYRNDKEYWTYLVMAAAKQKPKIPFKKSQVFIMYYFKDKRRRDPDNYSGKFILDGLKMAKIIEDDSFFNIRLILDADIDRKNPRTEITIKKMG